MELLALLGRPLDTAEREKALGIVRENGGVESAFSTAQDWAQRAVAACDALPASPATDALRAAPANLLSSVG
jgi:geranylgeranyl pyrophosphate synthase